LHVINYVTGVFRIRGHFAAQNQTTEALLMSHTLGATKRKTGGKKKKMRLRKIIAPALLLGGLAAVAVPGLASAATTTPPKLTFQLGAGCGRPAADYGRGVRQGATVNGHPSIWLSTSNHLVLTRNQVISPNAHGILTFTLSTGTGTGKRYLKVDTHHAWLGLTPEDYSIYAGYGDACGDGSEFIHLGGQPNGTTSNMVWTANDVNLYAAPIHKLPHPYMIQLWRWANG
jgi:hypothetical protein